MKTVLKFFAVLPASLICLLLSGLFNGVSLATEKTTLTLKVKSARVRENPSLKSDVEAGLKQGDIVTLIRKRGNWYNIRLKDGRTGWSHKSLFFAPTRSYTNNTVITEKPVKNQTDPSSAGELKEIPDSVTVEEDKPDISPAKTIDEKEVDIEPEQEYPPAEETYATVSPEQKKFPVETESISEVIRKEEPDHSELREVLVDTNQKGREIVIFTLNGFFPPETFVIEKGDPKIVCDFFGIKAGNRIKKLRNIKVNGKFVHQVRIGIHGGAKPKVRAVLDLVPGKYYDVEQQFYKDENQYALIVEQSYQ
ncbi:MAG: SH3 domain-containing protein [Desulfobacteraceae bacterium]|nr:SH3 domain-containing protein [Desulfobacteraceae bacterium]